MFFCLFDRMPDTVIFTLLGAENFYFTIHIFELYTGMQLCELEAVEFFESHIYVLLG